MAGKETSTLMLDVVDTVSRLRDVSEPQFAALLQFFPSATGSQEIVMCAARRCLGEKEGKAEWKGGRAEGRKDVQARIEYASVCVVTDVVSNCVEPLQSLK